MTLEAVERYVDQWKRAIKTARVTGRVIFGQLWYADPTTDMILRATYERAVCDSMNTRNALAEFFL